MKTMNNLPDQVYNLVKALHKNALRVEGWDQEMAESVVYVSEKPDGSFVVCDNYEKFFDIIYTYTSAGDWMVRRMFSDQKDRPYSYAAAMADAEIMFTG